MTEDLKNLAKHVKARRDYKDWSQLDVWNRGGPSNSKLTEIEDARPPVPSRSTLRKLDIGLDWESGSAKAVLAGGEPTPLPDGTLTRSVTSDSDDSVGASSNAEGFDGWLTRVREDLTAEQREQMWKKYEALFDTMADEAALATRPGKTSAPDTQNGQ